MFQVVKCSTWMPLVLYQEGTYCNPRQSRAGHTRQGRHWEPSLAVHVAISLGVHLGTLTAFERKGLIQDGEQVENGR